MGRPLPVDLAVSSPVDVVDSPSVDVASSYSVDVVASSPADVVASSPADVVASSPVDAVDSPSDDISPVRVAASYMFRPIPLQVIATYFARCCNTHEWFIASNTELSFSWWGLKDVYSRNPQELEHYGRITGVVSIRFGRDWGDEFYFEVNEGII